MRRRARSLVLFSILASGAACSDVLGINDRTLRPDDAGVTDDAIAPDGAADTLVADGGTEASLADMTVPPVDAGPGFAVFSGSAIDFGLASCGGSTPANRSLTLTNTGGAPLTWNASLAATPFFSLVGATAGTVLPGAFVTITLSAQGVPAFASPGTAEQGTLTVTTNDALHPSTDFVLEETVAGASLTLEPATVAFGQVPVLAQAADIPIVLRNTGNLTVALTFGGTTDPQFALVSDAGALLAPDATVSGLAGQFRPTGTLASSANAAITPSGAPMCGISPSNIHFTGQGTSSTFSIKPGSLDFGLVNCGSAGAASKQITVSSTGAPFSISAALAKAGASPYTFAIAPAGPATSFAITVSPNAIPTASSVAPDFFADTLTITAPDGPHPIALHETAQGAILTSSASSIAFGEVPTGVTATSTFTVKNNGNTSATVSFTSTNSAFAVAPQGQVIGGAGAVSTTTVSFSPTVPISYAGSSSMTVPGGTVLCEPLPPSISLSGTGTTNFVSITPSSLDFGLVNCGARAGGQTVSLQNTAPTGGASFSWTATLGKGAASPYALNQSSGTLNANANFALRVTPNAIPQVSAVTPDLYGDSLTIHTTSPGDTDHIVALHETAQGVILVFNPASINFGNVPVNASTPDSAGAYQVVNSGNVPGSISRTSGNTQFNLDVTSGTVNGGSTCSSFVTFQPTAPAGAKSTNVSLTSSAVNCGAAFPILLPLSGNGT